MASHGQNPSRNDGNARKQPNRAGESDVDAASFGGRASRPAVAGNVSSEASVSLVAFPRNRRFKQLAEPISGGMGVVFKALDVNLDIEVAIKRIRSEFAVDADLINRFEREAKTQRRIRHPNLVQVLDYDKDDVGPYIVMDWIEGTSLAAAIEKDGPMDWQAAAVLVGKVADALQVAHHAGIIHRDVKPANILLDATGQPYVTDFGLARIETTQSAITETATNAMLGTINFASPEQQRNPRNACFQSDIWSLGATLYKLLTGIDVLAMRESRIPVPLREIVLKATEHVIEERYRTMQLFAAALRRALQDAPSQNSNRPSMSADTASVDEKPAADATTSLAVRWKQMQQHVEKTQSDARTIAEKQQDYAAAAEMLETVPKHLRDPKLHAEIIRRRDRVAELDTAIDEAVKHLRLDGLRELLTELLTLQPRRRDIKQLLAELPPEPAPVTQKVETSDHQPQRTSGARPALLVAPFDATQAKAAQSAWAKHLGIDVKINNSVGMRFRLIPPGTFEMGSPASEPKRISHETLHNVSITQPKLLGIYPVTQGEWKKLMGSNPSYFTSVQGEDTSRFPVEQVSWEDSQAFLTQLNAQHGLKGWRYRLPTEGEWEYACRAGTVSPFWFGSELNGKQGNCNGTYPYPGKTEKGPDLNRPTVVGTYGANPFGICDQHGNVWEWCGDWYNKGYSSQSLSKDPQGPSSGSSRVLRGGSWYGSATNCRSAYRYGSVPSNRGSGIGFRVLCELV